jgi:hypothetical protein
LGPGELPQKIMKQKSTAWILAMRKGGSFVLPLLVALITLSCGNGSYHVKTLLYNNSRLEILLPPATVLPINFKGEYIAGTNEKYQAFFFEGLTSDLSATIEAVAGAEYRHYGMAQKNPLTRVYFNKYFPIATFTGSYGSVTIGVNRETEVPKQRLPQHPVAKGKFTNGEVSFFTESEKTPASREKIYAVCIQLDYDYLVKLDTTTQLTEKFEWIAGDLLRLFAQLESLQKFNIQAPIAQQIIEKFFELMPAPQENTLSRYLYTVNSSDALILLNPAFTVKTDCAQRIDIENGFYFLWEGANYFQLGRRGAKVIQNRFAYFPNTASPDNQFGSNTYQIGSMFDIQSSGMKDKPYVALYHPVLKRNNKPTSSIDPYDPDDDKNRDTGNAYLVHLNSEELTMVNFQDPHLSTYGKSVFGERNSAEPMITIWVNSMPRLVSINTRVSELTDLPVRFDLHRKYKGAYALIAGKTRNIILLDGDQLKFNL